MGEMWCEMGVGDEELLLAVWWQDLIYEELA